MGIVLWKTAFSANIKERRDYACAIYDGDGETVAIDDQMPVHLGSMPLAREICQEELRIPSVVKAAASHGLS